MGKYSKMMSAYVGIWVLASFINAVISTLIITPSFSSEIFGLFFLSLIFSFILSIPVLLLAMLITAIVLSQQTSDNIFGVMFLVTLFSSIAGAIFFKDLLSIFNNSPFPLGISVVISAVAATVIIFRSKLTEDNPLAE